MATSFMHSEELAADLNVFGAQQIKEFIKSLTVKSPLITFFLDVIFLITWLQGSMFKNICLIFAIPIPKQVYAKSCYIESSILLPGLITGNTFPSFFQDFLFF